MLRPWGSYANVVDVSPRFASAKACHRGHSHF